MKIFLTVTVTFPDELNADLLVIYKLEIESFKPFFSLYVQRNSDTQNVSWNRLSPGDTVLHFTANYKMEAVQDKILEFRLINEIMDYQRKRVCNVNL